MERGWGGASKGWGREVGGLKVKGEGGYFYQFRISIKCKIEGKRQSPIFFHKTLKIKKEISWVQQLN